jgi:hypothetical protein
MKSHSKAVQLVDYRAVLLNLRTACKLKLPHLTGGETDQAAAAERQKNITLLTSQSPGQTMAELLLISCHQDWTLKEQLQNLN